MSGDAAKIVARIVARIADIRCRKIADIHGYDALADCVFSVVTIRFLPYSWDIP